MRVSRLSREPEVRESAELYRRAMNSVSTYCGKRAILDVSTIVKCASPLLREYHHARASLVLGEHRRVRASHRLCEPQSPRASHGI